VVLLDLSAKWYWTLTPHFFSEPSPANTFNGWVHMILFFWKSFPPPCPLHNDSNPSLLSSVLPRIPESASVSPRKAILGWKWFFREADRPMTSIGVPRPVKKTVPQLQGFPCSDFLPSHPLSLDPHLEYSETNNASHPLFIDEMALPYAGRRPPLEDPFLQDGRWRRRPGFPPSDSK